jgi:hypothetical protein
MSSDPNPFEQVCQDFLNISATGSGVMAAPLQESQISAY